MAGLVPREILAAWGLDDAEVEPLGNGLINSTFALARSGAAERFVLQRVNPIFDPRIHHNILALTEHLASKGVITPRLVPTRAGELAIESSEHGVWRLQTRVSGVGFDALDDAAQARAAGQFVGRWHAALGDLEHEFVGLRVGVHDTQRHLETLRQALDQHEGHRLYAQAEPLGRALLDAAEALPELPSLAPRVGHGDLKINNLLFAGERGAARTQPIALIDLDTVGPMQLGHELGDAWRSWTNRAGEDQPQARFDLELLEQALQGWLIGFGERPSEAERLSLLLGPEWISLELATRFAADALNERYFGWAPQRFAGRGEHNLARAQGQWSLHQAIVASRSARERLLQLD